MQQLHAGHILEAILCQTAPARLYMDRWTIPVSCLSASKCIADSAQRLTAASACSSMHDHQSLFAPAMKISDSRRVEAASPGSTKQNLLRSISASRLWKLSECPRMSVQCTEMAASIPLKALNACTLSLAQHVSSALGAALSGNDLPFMCHLHERTRRDQ